MCKLTFLFKWSFFREVCCCGVRVTAENACEQSDDMSADTDKAAVPAVSSAAAGRYLIVYTEAAASFAYTMHMHVVVYSVFT